LYHDTYGCAPQLFTPAYVFAYMRRTVARGYTTLRMPDGLPRFWFDVVPHHLIPAVTLHCYQVYAYTATAPPPSTWKRARPHYLREEFYDTFGYRTLRFGRRSPFHHRFWFTTYNALPPYSFCLPAVLVLDCLSAHALRAAWLQRTFRLVLPARTAYATLRCTVAHTHYAWLLLLLPGLLPR